MWKKGDVGGCSNKCQPFRQNLARGRYEASSVRAEAEMTENAACVYSPANICDIIRPQYSATVARVFLQRCTLVSLETNPTRVRLVSTLM